MISGNLKSHIRKINDISYNKCLSVLIFLFIFLVHPLLILICVFFFHPILSHSFLYRLDVFPSFHSFIIIIFSIHRSFELYIPSLSFFFLLLLFFPSSFSFFPSIIFHLHPYRRTFNLVIPAIDSTNQNAPRDPRGVLIGSENQRRAPVPTSTAVLYALRPMHVSRGKSRSRVCLIGVSDALSGYSGH